MTDNVHTVVLTQAMIKATFDRLINRRDELLEVLKMVAEWDDEDGIEEWEPIRLKIDAAIAKAEGKEAL